jgi:hypothetical protein
VDKKPIVSKGSSMEELLRIYFLYAGYYVVRGVPFVYEGFDVTDIDLWLYGRPSSVSREISIVDIKNKKTPQAIERIFWIQGLKQAIKANNAIVATTDKRQEVKDFGKDMGVFVLDGSFLNRLQSRFGENLKSRLTDEEFNLKIDGYELEKIDGDWKRRIYRAKSLFSRGLSFDNCNAWLEQGKFFAEQAITKPQQREISLRCLYLICSFIAIAIDFILKELSFLEQAEKTILITDGFTYGSSARKLVDMSMRLIEQYASDGRTISNQVRTGINRQLSELPTNILGEYFSRNDVTKSIFNVAKEFEKLAMEREFSTHSAASIDLRGVLACLLDYWSIDRVYFAHAIQGL